MRQDQYTFSNLTEGITTFNVHITGMYGLVGMLVLIQTGAMIVPLGPSFNNANDSLFEFTNCCHFWELEIGCATLSLLSRGGHYRHIANFKI